MARLPAGIVPFLNDHVRRPPYTQPAVAFIQQPVSLDCPFKWRYTSGIVEQRKQTMQVPAVNSQIRVRVRNNSFHLYIPPVPEYTVYEGTVVKPYPWLSASEIALATANPNFPISVINLASVDGVELIAGQLSTVDAQNRSITVDGSRGKQYTVTRAGAKITCTCEGFTFRKSCKHLKLV